MPERKRFDVVLFIVHPTLTPAEINVGLGLDAQIIHGVKEQRRTPKRKLPGFYSDTRWRYSIRHKTDDQWFADEVVLFIERLEHNTAFLRTLSATGGRSELIIQFLGDGYFGDRIPCAALAKLVSMDVDLSIECFTDPQYPR